MFTTPKLQGLQPGQSTANLAAPSSAPPPFLLPDGRHWLLHSRACVTMGSHLHAFENTAFDPELRNPCEDFGAWFDSGCLLYAAICAAPCEPMAVAAVISILISHERSCARLVSGEIVEHELEPWSRGLSGSNPAIYFSTIVCPVRQWLPLLYASLLHDLTGISSQFQLSFVHGISIASTPSGARHLHRNGFRSIPDKKYLGHYDLMLITPQSAQSAFWQAAFQLPDRSPKAAREGAFSIERGLTDVMAK